jgi:predicted dehydrogenase
MDDQGRLGWGVLGTADIARRRFLPALHQSKHSYLAVLGSRSLDRARAVVAKHGTGLAAGSYEAVLADPTVDLVYVPLPGPLHQALLHLVIPSHAEVAATRFRSDRLGEIVERQH